VGQEGLWGLAQVEQAGPYYLFRVKSGPALLETSPAAAASAHLCAGCQAFGGSLVAGPNFWCGRLECGPDERQERINTLMGMFAAAVAVSGVACPVLSGALIERLGFRITFYAFAVLAKMPRWAPLGGLASAVTAGLIASIVLNHLGGLRPLLTHT
jgi:hypothetical protein